MFLGGLCIVNKRKKLFTRFVTGLIIPVILLLTSGADASPSEWNKTFGGEGINIAYSAGQTLEGGYFLAGSSNSNGYERAWLIKTDAEGNEQWNITMGDRGKTRAKSVLETRDGNYVIAGSTNSIEASDSDAWLIMIDNAGKIKWNKTFGGTGNDWASSAQITPDGGYILSGSTSSYGVGGSDMWLIKTDAGGYELWNRTFGGEDNDYAWAVMPTDKGGYMLAGSTSSFGYGLDDALIVRTDASGHELWNGTYGGDEEDRAYSIQQTGDGSYLIVISTHDSNQAGNDALLLKIDDNGNHIWNKTFGKNCSATTCCCFDWATSIQKTVDEGYIMAGSTNSFGACKKMEQMDVGHPSEPTSSACNMDAWVTKIDAKGNEQWNRTFGGTEYDEAYSVQETRDGQYILAGRTQSNATGRDDAWLVKFSPPSINEPDGMHSNHAAEMAAGFEIFMAIIVVLTVYIFYRKKG